MILDESKDLKSDSLSDSTVLSSVPTIASETGCRVSECTCPCVRETLNAEPLSCLRLRYHLYAHKRSLNIRSPHDGVRPCSGMVLWYTQHNLAVYFPALAVSRIDMKARGFPKFTPSQKPG